MVLLVWPQVQLPLPLLRGYSCTRCAMQLLSPLVRQCSRSLPGSPPCVTPWMDPRSVPILLHHAPCHAALLVLSQAFFLLLANLHAAGCVLHGREICLCTLFPCLCDCSPDSGVHITRHHTASWRFACAHCFLVCVIAHLIRCPHHLPPYCIMVMHVVCVHMC